MTAAAPALAGRSAPFFALLLQEAFHNLQVKAARSLLTLFGIGMGTGIVIALVHIGADARLEALRRFESVGIDYVAISPPMGEADEPAFDLDMAAKLPIDRIGLLGAVPLIESNTMLVAGASQGPIQLIGATPDLHRMLRLKAEAGRFLSDFDGSAPFVVLGAGLAQKVSSGQKAVEIGDPVRLGPEIFRLIGVLRPQPLNPLNGIDPDNTAFVGLQAIKRLIAPATITKIIGRLAPAAQARDVAENLRAYFRPFMRGEDVRVGLASDLLASVEQQMQIYKTLLFAVGSLSLVVSGVGVMNVMLISVAERRAEIGLRAALGASAVAIRAMFLMEALILSVGGSLVGLLVGFAIAYAFVERSGWRFVFAPSAVPMGLGMALAVGLFFGFYPAHRAASLDPIRALRGD